MDPMIIAALVFVMVTAVVGAAAYLMRDKGTLPEDRLEALTGKRALTGGGAEEHSDIWKKAAFEEDQKSLLEQLTPEIPSLTKVFEQAECYIKPSTLCGIAGLLFLGGCTVSWLLRVPIYLVPLLGIILGSLPFIWLWNKRRVRLKQFASQLPDALELVARALRAGHSLAAGMHVVGEEMPAPVSTEFRRVYEEQNLGISVEDSLRAMCERVPNLDLRFFVTSVIIQRQTGGDLAEILDKIGYVIRERFRILGQVKALTGEGRLSGVVLIALPFLIFFVVLHLNPTYLEPLWTTDAGVKMGVIAFLMQVAGALVIKKIVDIKV